MGEKVSKFSKNYGNRNLLHTYSVVTSKQLVAARRALGIQSGGETRASPLQVECSSMNLLTSNLLHV